MKKLRLKFSELPKFTKLQTVGVKIWIQACQTSILMLLVLNNTYQLVPSLLFYASLTTLVNISHDSSSDNFS